LHIEYEVTPAGNNKEPVGVATLVLRFDGATRRLADAQVGDREDLIGRCSAVSP
jgi:hypothetical protein